MVFVEHFACALDVDVLTVGLVPRQRDHGVEVRAHHPVFRAGLVGPLQALELFADVLIHLGGHAGRGDRLLEFLEVATGVAFLAELLLKLAQLLAQHGLALALPERCLSLLRDVLGDLQYLDPMVEELNHLVEPRLHIKRLEDGLSFARLDVDEAPDEVRELTRRVDGLHGASQLGRNLRQ